jgi:hypothetical protein
MKIKMREGNYKWKRKLEIKIIFLKKIKHDLNSHESLVAMMP